MKHLEAIQAIIGDKALSPQLKFERVFQYEQGVLQPAWENAATMPRESMLCYLIDVLSVQRKNPLVPKQEWEDLAPVFLEGIAEFITSNAESITDPGLPKVLAAWRAMETNKQYTLMGGMYFAGEEKFCNRNAPDKRRVIESGPPVEHLMAIQAIVEDKSLSAQEKFEELFQYHQNVLDPACISGNVSVKASGLGYLISRFSIFRMRPVVPQHEWEDLSPVLLDALAELIASDEDSGIQTAALSRMKQTRDRVIGGRYMENIQTLLQDKSLSPQERFENIFQYWDNVLRPASFRGETLLTEENLIYLIKVLSFLRRRPIVPKEEWEDLAPLCLEAIAEFIANDSVTVTVDSPDLPKFQAAWSEMEKRRDELVRGGKYFSDAEVYDWGTIEGMH